MADGKPNGWGERFNNWWMSRGQKPVDQSVVFEPQRINYNEVLRIRRNLGEMVAKTPGALRHTLEGMSASEQEAWNNSGPFVRLSLEDGHTNARIYETGRQMNFGRPARTVQLNKPIEQVTKADIHDLLNPREEP